MGLSESSNTQLSEALEVVLPLIRSADEGERSLGSPPPPDLAPSQRLIAHALAGLTSEELDIWSEVIGLAPAPKGSPLRAVSLRGATASALWDLIESRNVEEPFEATLGCLRLWFEGIFPLALSDHQRLIDISSPKVERALGLVIGMMGWQVPKRSRPFARLLGERRGK